MFSDITNIDLPIELYLSLNDIHGSFGSRRKVNTWNSCGRRHLNVAVGKMVLYIYTVRGHKKVPNVWEKVITNWQI